MTLYDTEVRAVCSAIFDIRHRIHSANPRGISRPIYGGLRGEWRNLSPYGCMELSDQTGLPGLPC